MLPTDTINDLKRLVSNQYDEMYLDYQVYQANQLLPDDITFKDIQPSLEIPFEFHQSNIFLSFLDSSSLSPRNTLHSQSSPSNSYNSSKQVPISINFHHATIPYSQISIDQIQVHDSSNSPQINRNYQNTTNIPNQQNSKSNSPQLSQLKRIQTNVTKSNLDPPDFDDKVQRILQLHIETKKNIENVLRSCAYNYNEALKKIRDSKKSTNNSYVNSLLKKLPPDSLKIYQQYNARAKKSIKTIISRGHDPEFSMKIFECCGHDEQQTLDFLEPKV